MASREILASDYIRGHEAIIDCAEKAGFVPLGRESERTQLRAAITYLNRRHIDGAIYIYEQHKPLFYREFVDMIIKLRRDNHHSLMNILRENFVVFNSENSNDDTKMAAFCNVENAIYIRNTAIYINPAYNSHTIITAILSKEGNGYVNDGINNIYISLHKDPVPSITTTILD